MLKSKSSRKVWWLCPICNKAYAATVQHRTAERRSTACPSCGHKRGALQFSIKVEMLDPQTSMVLKVFESISEATKVAHVSHQYIRMACDGKRETAGGHHPLPRPYVHHRRAEQRAERLSGGSEAGLSREHRTKEPFVG